MHARSLTLTLKRLGLEMSATELIDRRSEPINEKFCFREAVDHDRSPWMWYRTEPEIGARSVSDDRSGGRLSSYGLITPSSNRPDDTTRPVRRGEYGILTALRGWEIPRLYRGVASSEFATINVGTVGKNHLKKRRAACGVRHVPWTGRIVAIHSLRTWRRPRSQEDHLIRSRSYRIGQPEHRRSQSKLTSRVWIFA